MLRLGLVLAATVALSRASYHFTRPFGWMVRTCVRAAWAAYLLAEPRLARAMYLAA
jgi:hypothetical protein